MYRLFFFLRLCAEGFKIYIVLNLFISNPIFFKHTYFNDNNLQFYEFIFVMFTALLITIFSLGLVFYKMCVALKFRRLH